MYPSSPHHDPTQDPLLRLERASKTYQRGSEKVAALSGFSLKLLWRGLPPQTAGKPGPHLREIGALLEGRGAAYERLSTLENARYFCGLRDARFDAAHF